MFINDVTLTSDVCQSRRQDDGQDNEEDCDAPPRTLPGQVLLEPRRTRASAVATGLKVIPDRKKGSVGRSVLQRAPVVKKQYLKFRPKSIHKQSLRTYIVAVLVNCYLTKNN